MAEEVKEQKAPEEGKPIDQASTVPPEGKVEVSGKEEEAQKKGKARQWLAVGLLVLAVVAIYFVSPLLFGEKKQTDAPSVILVNPEENNPALIVTNVPSPVQPVETIPAASPTVAPTTPPLKSPLDQAREKLNGYEIPYYRGTTRFIFTVKPEHVVKLEKSTNSYSTWTATIRGAGSDGMPIIWLLFLDDDFGVVDKAKMTQTN